MVLAVDQPFPASLSPMEPKGCSRRWKTQIPEFIHSGTGTGTSSSRYFKDKDRDRDKEIGYKGIEDRERGGPRKSVTMAPTSRYMSDRRQYSVRKPLITSEQQTSILKTSHLQEHPKKERQWVGSRNEAHHHRETDFHTRRAGKENPDSLNPSQAGLLTFSASREDLNNPLGVSDLRAWLSQEEPAFGSPYMGNRPGRHSHSCPPREVHTLSSPLSPRWTSTPLSPLSPSSYTPHSHPSRPSRPELRQVIGGGGDIHLNMGSSIGSSKSRSAPALHTMTPHQANYWACVIPSSLPPSPDRRSPGWDPDKEYQALLDYTYPLRAGRVFGGWDISDLGGRSLLQTDPGIQDSGIELDRLCSSTSLSGLDFSLSGMLGAGTGRIRERGVFGVVPRSSELHGLSHSKSSDGFLSSSPFSSADPIGLSVENLDCGWVGGGLNHSRHSGGGGHYHYRQHGVLSSTSHSTSATFIRSTSVLPRPGCLSGGEWDEEFWPLPERLEEFQVLSQQVREVTAQLSQPVTASWESLARGSTSLQSSMTLAEKRDAEEEVERKEVEEGEEKEEEEEEEKKEKEVSIFETLQYFSEVADSGASTQAVEGPNPGVEAGAPGRGVSRASLREVEAMVEQLSGLALPEAQSRNQGEQGHRDSLMQHIQTFCSNLEELIQWLYTVVARMEVLAPPSVDLESVKMSLADYKSYQREVIAHQPLTTSVLQSGELLLDCMTSSSSVLKDTLALIERQSRALETHAEHLFSSILSAMDSLTRPPQPPQPRETEPCEGEEEACAGDPGRMEVQGF